MSVIIVLVLGPGVNQLHISFAPGREELYLYPILVTSTVISSIILSCPFIA